MCLFKAFDSSNHLALNVKRQTGGYAVRIQLIGLQALWFDKNLVTGFVGKPDNLVFYGGAIARPHALDHSRVHGRKLQPCSNNVVAFFIGGGDMAVDLLWVILCRTQVGHHWHRRV